MHFSVHFLVIVSILRLNYADTNCETILLQYCRSSYPNICQSNMFYKRNKPSNEELNKTCVGMYFDFLGKKSSVDHILQPAKFCSLYIYPQTPGSEDTRCANLTMRGELADHDWHLINTDINITDNHRDIVLEIFKEFGYTGISNNYGYLVYDYPQKKVILKRIACLKILADFEITDKLSQKQIFDKYFYDETYNKQIYHNNINLGINTYFTYFNITNSNEVSPIYNIEIIKKLKDDEVPLTQLNYNDVYAAHIEYGTYVMRGKDVHEWCKENFIPTNDASSSSSSNLN